MKPWQIENIKEQYPTGTKIELISMEGEPDMPCGLQGVVDLVDDIGQLQMTWNNGRTLAINPECDQFIKLTQEETETLDENQTLHL